MTITNIFKVYGDDKLAHETFTDNDKAVAWALNNCKAFGIVELELKDGEIIPSYEGCNWDMRFVKEKGMHLLVYRPENGEEEIVGRFPEKARRELVLCFIHTVMQWEEERHAFLEGPDESEEEGPFGGAFRDQDDYENWRFGGISYLNSI